MRDFFYSWYLLGVFLFSKYKGVRYPLTSRKRGSTIYHQHREIASLGVYNIVRFTHLFRFLKEQHKSFVLVCSIHENRMWVNVYSLVRPEKPTALHVRTYNQLWGDDGTFTLTLDGERLNHAVRHDSSYYVESAPLMSWVTELTPNEKSHLNQIKEFNHVEHTYQSSS